MTSREIIDESDVFIDVHRAIRRMAPAPKSRVPKGEVVASESTIVAGEEDLIDLAEDQKSPKDWPLRRNATADGSVMKVNGSHPDLGTSPKAAPDLRRISSVTGASDRESAPKRSNTLEHLKHLGPSNLASRPRQTRYNTVKIKPGGGSIPEYIPKTQETSETPRTLSVSAAPHGGVGAGLLSSAGKEAKDGVQALQAGYGSIGASPDAPKTPSKGSQSFPFDKTDSNQQENQGPNTSYQSPSDRAPAVRTNSHSTLGSLNGRSQSPKIRKTNSVARSGSITENIIDMGGIKKTVLETTSSSSDDAENRPEEGNAAELEEEEEDHAAGSEEQGKENDNGGEAGGRKKRRRRKRKGPKADEDTPLLER